MVTSVQVETPCRATQPAISRAYFAAWLLLGAGTATLLTVLFRVWMSLPEMNDRFLIPLAAAWLVRRDWARFRATPAIPSPVGLILVAFGAMLAPPAWFLLVQVGPRVVLLWWLLSSLAIAALGLLVAQLGWRRARCFAFPLAFCFLALPTPDRLQGRLQERLKEYTTTIAAAALPAIGIPVERRGHTLVLKSGTLGVVDACSGVRSVAALTAIALFVAYWRGFSITRGAVLIALTMGIVVVCNAIRIIATGVIQETAGPQYTQGHAHDALGYSVILVGLALIVAVSSLLAPRAQPVGDTELKPLPIPSARGGIVAALILVASLGGCLWVERFRAAHRNEVNLDNLSLTIGDWKGQNESVPEAVADMLKCDQLLHRVYKRELGWEFELYVLFWATPASTAHMHHPDICMPCQGWTTELTQVRRISFADDAAPIDVSVRVYSLGGQRQLVFYWTQTGDELLPDGKEDLAKVSDFAWISQMLRGDATIAKTSRLAVRVDTELPGKLELTEAMLTAATAEVAREVYRLCPWAKPPLARQ